MATNNHSIPNLSLSPRPVDSCHGNSNSNSKMQKQDKEEEQEQDQEQEVEQEQVIGHCDLDLSSLLPDEVLEFILSLASPYGELRAARQVNRRWRRCAHTVMLRRSRALVRATSDMKLRWKRAGRMAANVAAIFPPSSHANKAAPPTIQISKRYSHSACYDDVTLSMFVFGGCTCTSSTFNDLWRLDMTTRTWSRPAATGSYPSPKVRICSF